MSKRRDKVANKLSGHGVFLAKKGILFQAATAILITLCSGILGGYYSAMSVGAGALISILPMIIFSGFAFRYSGATKNELVARSFSQGSKLKLAFTVILFVVAFAGLKASPLAVFMGYVVTTVSHALAMFHYGTKK